MLTDLTRNCVPRRSSFKDEHRDRRVVRKFRGKNEASKPTSGDHIIVGGEALVRCDVVPRVECLSIKTRVKVMSRDHC